MRAARRIGRRKRERHHSRWVAGLIAGGVVFASYLFLFSPFLVIRDVRVEGVVGLDVSVADEVVGRYLARRTWWVVAGNRRVLFDGNELAQEMEHAALSLRSVEVDVPFFGGEVVVRGELREPFGIACRVLPTESSLQGGAAPEGAFGSAVLNPFLSLGTLQSQECFFFDRSGILYDEAPEARGALITAVWVGSQESLAAGERPLAPELFEWMASTLQTLQTESRARVVRFFIPKTPPASVFAETDEGWWMAFDAQGNLDRQTQAVVTALRERVDVDSGARRGLQYIDARVDGRVYFRAQ